jgi:hypothetical protein
MPGRSRKRHLGSEQRRALLLLAGIPFGATDAAISANGITRQTLVSLIRAGLATTEREIKASGQTIGRIRITEAGPSAPLKFACSSPPLKPFRPPRAQNTKTWRVGHSVGRKRGRGHEVAECCNADASGAGGPKICGDRVNRTFFRLLTLAVPFIWRCGGEQ